MALFSEREGIRSRKAFQFDGPDMIRRAQKGLQRDRQLKTFFTAAIFPRN